MINIIDRDFNFLGQIDNFESLMVTKSYSNIGSFELHLNDDAVNADKLIKENIIFTNPKKAYIILHREISSKDGKLVVQGKELKSYLARSPIFPPTGQAYYRLNTNVETIMKTYVQSTLTRKGITNIVVATNQNRGETLVYQTRYKNLADELEKLSLASGLGWDITLDLVNKKFVFDVVVGQDRTASQVILPPAIFSVDYDNISEQTLIDSKLNYANVAIVAGQGEGADRIITIVGDATGLDAYEVFVDARDIENDADLLDRGTQTLSEHTEIITFDSQVLADKNLIYEEDFNIGDTVTIQNKKWNITVDNKINEITEIYESSGFRLDITFGSNIPTVLDIIKQAIDAPLVEGGGVVGETPTASIIPVDSDNFTSDNVEGALDELFINVSSGKDLVATAITDKGVIASGGDTFSIMATKIGQISTGKKFASGITVGSSNTIAFTYAGTTATYSDAYVTVSGLNFLPSFIYAIDKINKQFIVYSTLADGFYANNKTIKSVMFNGTTGALTVKNIKADAGGAYVNATGFRFPCSYYNASYEWIAIE